jgi:hypothetical protein
MHARIRLLLPLLLLASTSVPAAAENVGTITGLTLQLIPVIGGPPGTPPIPLDRDPNDAVNDLSHFSIPPGGTVIIKVDGTAAGPGPVVMKIFDYDGEEEFRGFDDELMESGSGQGPGGTFTIFFHLTCPVGSPYVEDLNSSGEQSAEIYIQDGNKRFPAERVLANGKKKRGFWRIDCDKDTTEYFNTNGEKFRTRWGDSLSVRPGALSAETQIRIANMYPLEHTEQVPDGYGPISEALRLEPDGMPLLVPSRLTFLYTPEEVGEIADESTLQVFRHDAAAGRWDPFPGATVDVVGDFLSVDIVELGTYGFAAASPDMIQVRQVVETAFGDNTLDRFDAANGSELVAGGAALRDGRLQLFFSGNLESNFNNLEVFLDTRPGGQNRLRGDNAPVDFGGLNRMGDDGSGNGLRFDAGFEPDFWLGITGGHEADVLYHLYANSATLDIAGGGAGAYLGTNEGAGNGVLVGGSNPHGIRVALDNSNIQGVLAGCGSANPQDSTWTGIDISIPIAALGGVTECIRICAFVNGNAHAFVSNQFLGPLPPGSCNPGEPRSLDLAAIPGAQFFQLCNLPVGVSPSSVSKRAWASPNPFRDRVNVRWAGRDHVVESIEIFDIVGRRVRTLAGESASSGSVRWDGLNEAKASVPPGLYFLRLRGAGTVETLRLIRLR